MAEGEAKFERNVLVSTTDAAVLAVTAVAAKAYGVPDEVLAGLAVAAPQMIRVAQEGYERCMERRAQLLSVGFVAGTQKPERAIEAIVAAQDAPHFEAVMFETYRNMAQAIDDSVVPALGMLAGEYDYGRRRPDTFFRSTGRLLCDLDAEAFSALRRILREEIWRDEHRDIYITGEDPYIPLLQHLLSAPGLKSSDKGRHRVDGRTAIKIPKETAKRLQRLIDPFPEPAEPPPRKGITTDMVG